MSAKKDYDLIAEAYDEVYNGGTDPLLWDIIQTRLDNNDDFSNDGIYLDILNDWMREMLADDQGGYKLDQSEMMDAMYDQVEQIKGFIESDLVDLNLDVGYFIELLPGFLNSGNMNDDPTGQDEDF